MKTILTAFFLLLLINVSAQARLSAKPEKKQFSIGEVSEINSSILGEKRILNIYLPRDYKGDSIYAYPVIYLLDGSADEDFIHIAGLVQFMNFSWIQTIPNAIVVGITNVDRKRDFTYPTNNEQDKLQFPTTGGSEKFMAFIKKELQPFMSKNYRVTEDRTIIGQSLGGLLATEVLLKRPSLFNRYIIVSPSLWWDDGSLLSISPSKVEKAEVYIGVGKEGKVMEGAANDLHKHLKENEEIDLEFMFFEDQGHSNILHMAVYDAFEKLDFGQENKGEK